MGRFAKGILFPAEGVGVGISYSVESLGQNS